MLYTQRTVYLILCLLFGLLLSNNSCQTIEKPDVTHLTVDLPIVRFEQQLFQADSTKYPIVLKQLAQAHPEFFSLYVQQILGYGENSSFQTQQQQLSQFLTYPTIRSLYDTVQQHFPDLTLFDEQLTAAFQYYKYYFPNKSIPKTVYTHISEFGAAAATLDSTLIAISLDMYLGKDFVYYPSVGIPNYLSQRLRPEYMVVNAMAAYLKGIHEQAPSPSRLVDKMIYEGKILYILDLLLPDVADSLKMGYTTDKLAWCKTNEASIWAYLIQENLLFEGQYRNYNKYISEAPHTAGMPPEAPGRAPLWIGWQIVQQFMEKQPTTSLAELLAIQDGQKILTVAQYRPR